MDLQFLPLLSTQRELLEIPRGMERFKHYIGAMLGGTDDLVLPIGSFNPMSKPHVTERLDELRALGAEDAAAAAVAQAEDRLRDQSGVLRVGLVLADDAMGGWTNRYLTDAAHRFQSGGELKRGFATVLLWTGEPASRDQIRTEVMSTIYRAAYRLHHSVSQDLRALLVQEGLATRFAGVTATLTDPALAPIWKHIRPYLEETHYPTVIACLYGDEAATTVGYPPLGFPAYAGFAIAPALVAAEGLEPLDALRQR